MRVSEFDFALPQALIATYPLENRTASRLFTVFQNPVQFKHNHFADLVSLVKPGDLIIFNDTRVMAARLFGKKPTGGRVEILIERVLDDHTALIQAKSSKGLKVGTTLILDSGDQCAVLDQQGQFWKLALQAKDSSFWRLIDEFGVIPLPPYMHRDATEMDKIRYQTVYAKEKGSVAAPTAGLHFDESLIQSLKENGVSCEFITLHVGAGTFAPIRVDELKDHVMHAEYIDVPESVVEKIKQTKAAGGRVIAVGTTTLRSLETAAQSGEIQPYQGETRIFIYPGYQFQCVDVLITNFHLPQSTLFMLVSAFAGKETMLNAYQEAIALQYRFYSYGDAMWLTRL